MLVWAQRLVEVRVVDDVEGMGNHPLNLRKWWRYTHILTRGEEVCRGLSLRVETPIENHPTHHDGEVGGASAHRTCDEFEMPVGGWWLVCL